MEFIRELFDGQSSNLDKTVVHSKSNKEDSKVVKKNLEALKEEVNTKMDQYYMNRGKYDDNGDETLLPAAEATWMRGSDESFLRWEQDCETTIKEPVTAGGSRAGGVVRSSEEDLEMAAMENLMREYNLDQNQTDADETQLADIEPPSGMWGENTILGKMTSPVKMVGLMRPSTIIEENTLFNESLASSYKTAGSGLSKTAASETFQTASAGSTFTSTASTSSGDGVIEIMDDTLDANTLDEVSSLPDESYGSSSTVSVKRETTVESDCNTMSTDSLLDDSPRRFNDTLERIEYMEERGRQLLEKQKTPSTLLLSDTCTLLPTVQQPKREFYPSPKALVTQFKKPSAIRSPQIKFVPSKRNFDHIVSPVATYIKDVPGQTQVSNSKPQCLFGRNSPAKISETKENHSSGSNKMPQHWNIPRKVFTSTNHRHVSLRDEFVCCCGLYENGPTFLSKVLLNFKL